MSSGSIEAGKAFVRVSLKNDIKAGTREIQAELAKLSGAFRAFGALEISSAMFKGLKGIIGLLAQPIKIAADIQAATTDFEALSGSALSATRIVNQLRQFAANTSLKFEGLANTTSLLLGYGDAVDTVVENTKLLSAVARGDQDRLSRIALAFGQARAQGRLLATELRQLTEAGFNPLQEVSRTSGKSLAELMKVMSDGAFSFDMLRSSLISVTSAGGRFFGFLEKRAQTLKGLFDNMVDNLHLLAEAFAKPLIPALSAATKGLTTVLQIATKFAQDNQQIVLALGGMALGAGVLTVAIGGLGAAFVSLTAAKFILTRTATSLGLIKAAAVDASSAAVVIETINDEATAMSATIAIAAQRVNLFLKDMQAQFLLTKKTGVDAFRSIASASVAMSKAVDTSLGKSITKIAAFTSAMNASIKAANAATAAATVASGLGGGSSRKRGGGGKAKAATASAASAAATTAMVVAESSLIVTQNALTLSITGTSVALAAMTKEMIQAAGTMVLLSAAAKASFASAVKPVGLLSGAVADVTEEIIEDAVIITNAGLLEGPAKKAKKQVGVFSSIAKFISGAFVNVGVALAPLISKLGVVRTVAQSLVASIAAVFGGGTVATIGATVAVVAALAGGFTYLLNRAGLLKPLIDGVMSTFNDLRDVLVKTFGGISDALGAGEYTLAAEILWSGVKLAFYKGINAAIDVIPQALLNGVSIVKALGQALIDTFVDIFKAIPKLIYASLTGTQSVYKIIGDIFTGNFDNGELEKVIANEEKNLDRLTNKAAAAKKKVEETKSTEQKNLEFKEKEQQAIRQARDNEIAAAQNAAIEMNRQMKNISNGVHQMAASLSDDTIKKANKEAGERADKLRDETRELLYGKQAAEQYKLASSGVTAQRRAEIAILSMQVKMLETQKKAQEKATAIQIDIASVMQGEAAANRLKLAQEGLTRAQIDSLSVLEAQKVFVTEAKEVTNGILASQEKLAGDKNGELARSRELQGKGLNEAQIQEILLLERRKRALDEQVDAQKKLIDDAKSVKESMKSPFEEFQTQVDQIRKMVAAGLLTSEEGDKAIQAERRKMNGGVNGIATTVSDRSGAGLFNAIRGTFAGSEGDKLLAQTKIGNKIALKQQKELEKIRQKETKRHIAKFGAA